MQVVTVKDGSLITGSTATPWDDTIPQNTEGTEFLTLAITPRSAANKLLIAVIGDLDAPIANNIMTMALFKDSDADAIAAVNFTGDASGTAAVLALNHAMTAGSTSEITFKMRAGTQAGAFTNLNGYNGTRNYGGVSSSSIIITEIAA